MEVFREELDTLSNMHKQVEAHSQQQKSELAVTKRCVSIMQIGVLAPQGPAHCCIVPRSSCRITYATDEALQQLEKDKAEQDALMASLHQRIQTQKDAVQLYREQSAVQEKEMQEVRSHGCVASWAAPSLQHSPARVHAQHRPQLTSWQKPLQMLLRCGLPGCLMQADRASSCPYEGAHRTVPM